MIVLTGDKGFIGQALKRRLGGQDVVGVEIESSRTFLETFDDWRRVSLVLHQGALSSTTNTDLQQILDFNVGFTLGILEKCRLHGVPVKYASSASVYGDRKLGSGPLNLYAASKQIIDLWVMEHLDSFPLIQGFRYFNVFGAGETEKVKKRQASPVSTFFFQALTQGEVRVFAGSKHLFRDFVWVEDVASIVLDNREGSGIYDLGTGVPTSFQEVAEAVASRCGVPVREIPMPANVAKHYQSFTKSSYSWDHPFTSVGEFIENCDLDQWSI